MFKRIIKWFLALISILLFSVGVIIFLAVDSQPSVTQHYQLDSVAAQKSKQLLKRTLAVLKQQKPSSNIIMSQDELNGLSALLNRAVPNVTSNVVLSKQHLNLAFSYTLPIFERYINISTQILPSQTGLELGAIYIGNLALSGKVTLKITRWLLNTYVQPSLGDSLLTMVRQVTLTNEYSLFILSLPKNLIIPNKEGSLLIALRDNLSLFGDPEVIRIYYQELVKISISSPEQTSLAYYLRHIFKYVQQRNFELEGDIAVNENQAALLALALYFGADKFELLVGKISQLNVNNQMIRRKLQRNTVLHGRVDLQKHFVYSVALQIFSSLHASDAIGEFKEFLDSNKGGSGFSFADLLADRAGTRLAELATDSQQSALKIQRLLANIEDETLLPSIKGLPEGLSSQRFEAKYKAIQAQAYQNMLLDIDQRLSKLTLYQVD